MKSIDDVPELLRRVGPEGCLVPVEEDRGMEVDKTITVFLPNDMSSKPPFNSKETQALSLQDFPHVEVKFDDHSISNAHGDVISSYYKNTKDVCNDLGITTEYDWPIDPAKPPNPEFTRDARSICHDSTMGLPVTSPTDADLCTLPNLSDVLNKISPHHVVRVAVLDTGVLPFHKAFADKSVADKSVADKSVADKIVAMKNFVPNEDNDLYYDVHGHGTHCAGIVLQTAPFVRLVICKVLDSQGRGQPKWAADAVDWLLGVENCPVDIISMSLGSDSYDSEMRRAVSEAVARGKVVVAAASNDGRKGMTNIGFPARLGDVICVGSHDSYGYYQPSSFSSTGRELDFLAPGEQIAAPDSRTINFYRRMSGTSQATPIIAGIAAMVISYAETVGGKAMRNAVSNTTVVREIFRKMASKPGHHDEHMGYGNLNPWRLFKYGPDHFRQVVEEIVGPLPALRTRRASDSELEMKKRM
uniref:Peptidase S8/S53 domain-containing protein n=1 Tax=Branchiostoma floridae TaxID=7739 RepID=C3ZH47_BRAFL|eukprot:XP_002592183.1 hypothetical protein BRAFLDRAFT_88080 [Branchiostoma floridae]